MNITSTSNPYRQYVEAYKAEKEASETDSDNDSSAFEALEDFTCGLLGLDSGDEEVSSVEAEGDDEGLFYNMGQYVKAAGSVASMISFFV